MLIVVGENINDDLVQIQARTDDGQYEMKNMELSNAIDETVHQILPTTATRALNPLWNFLYKFTGKSYGFTKQERILDFNSA